MNGVREVREVRGSRRRNEAHPLVRGWALLLQRFEAQAGLPTPGSSAMSFLASMSVRISET